MKIKHKCYLCPKCGEGCLDVSGLVHVCKMQSAETVDPKDETKQEITETKKKRKKG